MREKGSKIIFFLIVNMISIIICTFVYSKIKPKYKQNNDIVQSKQEKKVDKKISEQKYINYINSNIDVDNGKLDLKINQGIFTINFNNTPLKLTGINEKIKSFTYDKDAFVAFRNNNGIIITLLSESNNVYVGFYEKNDRELYFRRINTNLKIKNITVNEIIKTGKSSIKTAVVLDNNEIRPIIESGNIYIISNKDVSKIEQVFDNIVIRKDGTLSTINNVNTELQFQNKSLNVTKLLSVKPDISNSNNYLKCYYIISNNRLFKLCGKVNNNINQLDFDNIELVNKKVVIATTNLNKGYIDNQMEYEITYDDNTKEIIVIEKAYIR